MHVVVTGAGGYVGRALVARLRQQGRLGDASALHVTEVDMRLAPDALGDATTRIMGSIADRSVVARAFDRPVDVVFHLASVPGGMAERNYELGRDVNLGGTTALLEAGKTQVEGGGAAPVFVFASSIGVFGSPLPALVDDDTPAHPQMTYGAHKLVGEVLVAEFTRRGWVDGRSLRLPGVLARPAEETGHLSAFISQMIRELGAGRSFVCPVSAHATTWGSSCANVVDNLLHAATVEGQRLGPGRCVTLPTLRFRFDELGEAIAAVHGPQIRERLSWSPDQALETLFGQMPVLRTAMADAAGFRHDGDLATLVRRATEPMS